MKARMMFAGLLLATSTGLLAQGAAPAQTEGRHKDGYHRADCAKSADPAQCEARRKEMRENLGKAREACKGQEGTARGACMARQVCAKAADPAKCEASARDRAEKHKERHAQRETKREERKARRDSEAAPKN